MLLALGPLLAVFLEPGSLGYHIAVGTAGARSYAAVAAASDMLLGFATGISGLLYIVVGRLQEAIGVGPAMVSAIWRSYPPHCWPTGFCGMPAIAFGGAQDRLGR